MPKEGLSLQEEVTALAFYAAKQAVNGEIAIFQPERSASADARLKQMFPEW